MATPGKFGIARDLLIERAQAARRDLVNSLEHGDREWEEQCGLLKRYQQFLSAADALYEADGMEQAP